MKHMPSFPLKPITTDRIRLIGVISCLNQSNNIQRNDTTTVYFNYFLSTTHAFQFLADHGWQLIDVDKKIVSGYENVQDGELKLVPVTKLTSNTVYYFKKDIFKQ